MHPRSGRRTLRPGGSKGPSPRSRRCRTCPSRPDSRLPRCCHARSHPIGRAGPTGACPAAARTADPLREAARTGLAVAHPASPPSVRSDYPPARALDRIGRHAAPRRSAAKPRSSRERSPISVPPPPPWGSPSGCWAPSRRPCRAVRKPGLASPSLSRTASIQGQLWSNDNNNCRGRLKKLLIKSAFLHNRYRDYPPVYPQARMRAHDGALKARRGTLAG